MTTTYGIKIVTDEDFVPFGDDESAIVEETEKIDAGEWTAYGVTLMKKCECCQAWSAAGPSLWGIVIDTVDSDESILTDLTDVPDGYLREIAKELIVEAQAFDAKAIATA